MVDLLSRQHSTGLPFRELLLLVPMCASEKTLTLAISEIIIFPIPSIYLFIVEV